MTRPSTRHQLREFVAENGVLLLLLLVLASILLSVADQLLIADSWMTLVAGREIFEHGLPAHEALTRIPEGREWVDQQWLAQVLFYGAWRVGGMHLILLLDVLLVMTTFSGAVWAARRRGASARSTLVCVTACVVAVPWAWQLRAQSFALPLFVGVVALLSADRRLERRRTLVVFALLVLWANLHGSALLGAGLASLAGVIALGYRVSGRSTNPSLVRGLSFAVLPWLCLLASPYATGVPGYYRLLLVDSPVSKVITEWQAPSPRGWMLFFFALAAITVVLALWRRRRLSLFELGVLAVCLAGALRSGRGVVWFTLAVAVLLPVVLDRKPGNDRTALRPLVSFVAAGLGAVFAIGGLAALLVRPTSELERGWPQGALRAVTAATNNAGVRAVWPSDKHGDWLLFKLPRASRTGRLRRPLRTPHRGRAEIDRALQVPRGRVGAGAGGIFSDRGRSGRHREARRPAPHAWRADALSRRHRRRTHCSLTAEGQIPGARHQGREAGADGRMGRG